MYVVEMELAPRQIIVLVRLGMLVMYVNSMCALERTLLIQQRAHRMEFVEFVSRQTVAVVRLDTLEPNVNSKFVLVRIRLIQLFVMVVDHVLAQKFAHVTQDSISQIFATFLSNQ
jgi:hypothetical protein